MFYKQPLYIIELLLSTIFDAYAHNILMMTFFTSVV